MICLTDQAVGESRITSSLRVAERSGETGRNRVNAAHRNSADPTMIKIPPIRSALTSIAQSLTPSVALEVWPRLAGRASALSSAVSTSESARLRRAMAR